MVRKKDMTEYERICAEMTVLERQIQSRAGQWELRSGKWFDQGLDAFVLKCAHCKHLFLAKRPDKKTCCDAHRKARSISNAKSNLKQGQRGTML